VATIGIPDVNWNGSETIIFTATDTSGASASDSATFTVNAVNDAPVVVSSIADQTLAEDFGSVVVADLDTVFSDIDGDTLSFSASSSGHVVPSIDENNVLSISSTEDFNGKDTVIVTANDNVNRATVSDTFVVVVSAVNDAPVLAKLHDISFPEDGTFSVYIDTIVTDVDDPIDSLRWSVTFINLAENARDSIQVVYDTTTHIVTFVPDSNFYLTNQPVEIKVTDPHNASDQDTLLMSIIPVNDPPVITELPKLVYNEDDTLYFPLSNWFSFVEDPDTPDSTLNYSVLSGKYVISVIENDTIKFTSPDNWFGNDTLKLIVSDGIFADTAQFIVSVEPVNDPPVISDLPEFLEFSADTSLSLNIWEYVDDVETQDSLLSYNFNTSNDSLIVAFEVKSGLLTLSANPEFSGEVSLFVTVSDDSGATAKDTIKIMVNPNVIADWNDQIPTDYVLYQNYPNPFNPMTTIKFGLPRASNVKIEVYNILGQRVAVLLDGYKPAGYHSVKFDASNFGSGLYIYRIQADHFSKVMKMLFVK